jgi:hypothetical protein
LARFAMTTNEPHSKTPQLEMMNLEHRKLVRAAVVSRGNTFHLSEPRRVRIR